MFQVFCYHKTRILSIFQSLYLDKDLEHMERLQPSECDGDDLLSTFC